MARHIKFLSLAYNGTLLACHTHWSKEAPEPYEATLQQIFASAGWAALRSQNKHKLELKSGANVYCIETDANGRIYTAVVTAAYPIRHIFSAGAVPAAATGSNVKLMSDFMAHVQANFGRASLGGAAGSLQRSLSRFLEALAVRYDDLDALDKFSQVQTSLSQLQSKMAANIRLVDERQSLLEAEVGRSRSLEASSRAAYLRTASMRRRACCARYKVACWVATIVLILLAIIAAAVLGINYSKAHWWR